MKIKQILTLIAGITFVALSPTAWAAGHGGGGGEFGGGGFSGGGGGHSEAEVEVQGPAVVVSTGVAASKQVGSMVADKSHMELAAVEVASALAECACQMVFRTLRARDPGSPRLGPIAHTTSGGWRSGTSVASGSRKAVGSALL